ncbi:MAG TPA: response regulator, partial [Gemmatimonadaceae bacterium]
LKLIASYAYRSRKHVANRFFIGEGLIGQAALEKQPILLTNVPDDYIQIMSGLGEAPPRNIIVLPILFEGEVKAVIELASFLPFSQIHLTFLDQLAESIGVVLNMISANMRTEELLEQSQKLTQELQSQSKELQQQQEELKRSNSELEAQAKSLRQSEELLKEQQEELQQVNEELEEKANLLAEQNRRVEEKNVEVERASQALKEQAAQLALSSKYKSEFLANMSHELRTPLNSLLILARLLSENKEGTLSAKQVEFAKTIFSSGTDLLNLINDILDLSKVEAGKMEVNPADVTMNDVRDFVDRTFKPVADQKGLNFRVEVAPGAPASLFTDGQRLQQVLKNLISNAIKFTEHGEVALTVRRAEKTGAKRFQNPVLDKAPEVVAFAVTDTGIGIPKDKQQLSLEAFQQADGTTSRKFGGTGLGLTISRQIAHLLGGEIRVESTPGTGSTFTLFLPATYVDPEAPQGGRPARSATTGGGAPSRAGSALSRLPARTGGAGGTPRSSMFSGSTSPSSGRSASLPTADVSPRGGTVTANGGSQPDASFGGGAVEATPAPRATPAAGSPMALPDFTFGEEEADTGVATMDDAPPTALADVLKPTAYEDDRDNIQPGDRVLLVVEDDENFARVLLEMARGREFKGIIALRGRDALTLAHEYKPDAITLDIGMADMDGWEVLDRLKHHPDTRHIPVHIVSGDQNRQQGLRAGAFAYLEKPVSKETLDDAFSRMVQFIDERVKRLLVVEDDANQRQAIVELIAADDVEITAVASAGEAIETLRNQKFDCMVIDLGLADMSGFELLETVKSDPAMQEMPVIVYTGKELTQAEDTQLRKYAETIIVKDVKSPERLLDETALFLHRVEAKLPEQKRRMLEQLHNADSVFAGKRIMVVDDDVRNIFSLTSVLEDHGMQVRFAENGKDAIAELEKDPNVDLVLMDIMMPEMDGYDTTREIRRNPKFRSLPIIALTAKAMKGDREKTIAAGASDYITKPVDTEQLLSLMRVWLYR